ncbi:uncharacterized protein LOC134222112 [Armigeres subalbatus]|uniref:uncharacterized protein LOC134222112 n=1 Tax=Armigeres subalbatus TaxID=124917 RepID=UPI002ED605AD
MPSTTRNQSKKRVDISPTEGDNCKESTALENPAKRSLHSDDTMSKGMTLTDLHKLLQGEIQSSKEEIQNSIMDMKADLKKLSVEVDDVKKSQAFINAEFEKFKGGLCKITEEMKTTCSDITALKSAQGEITSRIATMGSDVRYIQQEQLSNNMLISNVIKTADEDLCAILCKICEFLQVELFERDVLVINRLATRNTKQIEPILVQFANRFVKDRMMSAIKTSPLSCKNIGFPINQRIFFNHHLTAHNQALLQAVRLHKKKYSYKFVWFSRGYIYIKRDENSTALRILSREDLPSESD